MRWFLILEMAMAFGAGLYLAHVAAALTLRALNRSQARRAEDK